MSENVICKQVTYINNRTAAGLTQKTVDLDSCYGDSEIVIKVHAASLNPVDIVSHQLAHSFIAGGAEKPYGRDYSGVIVRRGKNVDLSWCIGDKVNGLFAHVFGDQGSMSDYLVLDPSVQTAIAHMKPLSSEILGNDSEFTLHTAWPLVFSTAYKALYEYGQKLGPDSRILVIGASTSVSNALVQIAKNHLGVGTIVGVCSKNSIEYNKKLGYDYLATYDEGPMIESVEKVLADDLGNQKFDLIFDSVGNSDFFPVMDKYLKPKSQNAYYISIAGDSKSKYDSPSILGNFRVMARMLNPFKTYNYVFFLLHSSKEGLELGHQLIIEGKYRPQIDSTYSIEDFQAAISRLSSNKAKGKVVVNINE